MKILQAKHNGFCKGVEHAVNTALQLGEENAYILGEIIHNAEVMNLIRKKGLKVVDNLDEIPSGGTVIFRSHGVPENFYGECKQRNIKIIDCTCGFVKKTQKIVAEQSALGNLIVIIGEPTHPEVVGLLGWCKGEAIIINGIDDIPISLKDKNICIVSQTTYSAEKFEKIIKIIQKLCEKTVAVFKTICYTTTVRQFETENLAKQCEAMLVIGGLNSSNTNKLYEIASKHCSNVFRLANAEQMDYSKIKRFKSIGIVSGASTPSTQTQEVLLKMTDNTEVKATNPTMEEAVAKYDNESKFKKGQMVEATISKATEEGLQVLLPFSKKEVVLSKDELDCEHYNLDDYASKVGEQIQLLVVELKPSLKLSQKLIRTQNEDKVLSAELESGKELKVVCTAANKGGLVGVYGTYDVFVPAKEVSIGYANDLSKYVGKTLRLRKIEVRNSHGKKEIIASQKVILEEERKIREAERKQKEDNFFDNIAVGDVVEGKVVRIANFGAFVSVRGFDCLAHVTQLSWSNIESVGDVLEVDKTYNFKVLKIERDKKEVSLGYKQLQPHPWDLVEEKYAVGDIVHGKVVRIVSFGAFIKVEDCIDGMVHVSQIAHERIETPSTILKIGDEVDAKIIELSAESRKMSLSIKALLPEPVKQPKVPKSTENKEEKPDRKARFTKRQTNEEELSAWSDGSIGGTSIGDLLANAKKNK